VKKKVAFVINPVSGTRANLKLDNRIAKAVDDSVIACEIGYSEFPGHAYELSKAFAGAGYDAVVAVGGDGSLNETGRALVNTSTAMGIIPTGSGNGMARYLGIPLQVEKAVYCINQFHTKPIDTATFNGHFFCNMAGAGFDGTVAKIFASLRKRGFWSYLKAINKRYWHYPGIDCRLVLPGRTIERDIFMVSFANSNQYGNNARIAPQALIDDGMLDICIMRKPMHIEAPLAAGRLMLGIRQRKGLMEYVRASEAEIFLTRSTDAHIDGEALPGTKHVRIQIYPASLSVIVPAGA
jgi:diacylglycerol kinase (ATP)